MKKKKFFSISMVALVLVFCVMFTACTAKFTCDVCGQEERGEKYDLSGWGWGHVCKECYDYLRWRR